MRGEEMRIDHSTKRLLKRIVIVLILFMAIRVSGLAQNPDLVLSDEERERILQNYKSIFPIWGKKAIERGFDLPFPVGIGINYLYMKQDIGLGALGLSAGDNPTQPVDFIQFSGAESEVSSYNVRLDLWVLPFLNVYGLYGRGQAKTTVVISEPIEFESGVDQTGNFYGIGFTTAIGIKRNWLSFDINWTWSDLELLENPVEARVLGIRYGRTIKLSPKKRLTFWIGTMNQKFETVTQGSVLLADVIPAEFKDTLQDYQNSEWYLNLNPVQKGIADQLMDAILNSDLGQTNVNYRLDKEPATPWNMLLGSNFELNKRWHIRAEAGLIGRFSFLVGLNYRFKL
jgi:hypothetical protein